MTLLRGLGSVLCVCVWSCVGVCACDYVWVFVRVIVCMVVCACDCVWVFVRVIVCMVVCACDCGCGCLCV